MRRAMVMGMVVAALAWPASGHAQSDGARPPSSPFDYAVFGLGDVTLQNGVRAIDGDVGSNNGTTTIGQDVRVAGAVVGRTIKLRQNALPDSLFCLLLRGGSSTLMCQAVTLPIVSASQLPPVQVVPGTMNVKVPSKGSRSPAPPGAYGNLRIGSRGTLVLAGGTYVFRSIRVNSRGQLLCAAAAACQIGVSGTVTIKSRGVLGGTGSTRAEAIRVNVARVSSNTVFSAGTRSNVSAVVYAPGGRIVLQNRGNFVGAFVGSTVRVRQGALVQARSS